MMTSSGCDLAVVALLADLCPWSHLGAIVHGFSSWSPVGSWAGACSAVPGEGPSGP